MNHLPAVPSEICDSIQEHAAAGIPFVTSANKMGANTEHAARPGNLLRPARHITFAGRVPAANKTAQVGFLVGPHSGRPAPFGNGLSWITTTGDEKGLINLMNTGHPESVASHCPYCLRSGCKHSGSLLSPASPVSFGEVGVFVHCGVYRSVRFQAMGGKLYGTP